MGVASWGKVGRIRAARGWRVTRDLIKDTVLLSKRNHRTLPIPVLAEHLELQTPVENTLKSIEAILGWDISLLCHFIPVILPLL